MNAGIKQSSFSTGDGIELSITGMTIILIVVCFAFISGPQVRVNSYVHSITFNIIIFSL